MKHNYSKTFHQKKELAVAIELQEDLINRLFFSARNLAITKALYTLENHLMKLGFDVKAEWKESSFGDPHIELIMMEKRKSIIARCVLNATPKVNGIQNAPVLLCINSKKLNRVLTHPIN